VLGWVTGAEGPWGTSCAARSSRGGRGWVGDFSNKNASSGHPEGSRSDICLSMLSHITSPQAVTAGSRASAHSPGEQD
jgi:hypothetical protein